jgi:glycerophosphoryl diester phosphodiesterase
MHDVQQRLPSLMDPPVAFAHRGARAHAPENTIESFRLALKLGATGLESDVWLTSDGVAVLDHDGVVKSRLRKQAIRDVRRSALPAHIPTVAEFIDACGTGFHLSLDVKDLDAGPTVIHTVREAGADLLPRLWLCQSTWQGLAGLRDLSDEVKLIESTRLARIKEGPERRAATLASEGIDGINMHHTDWNGGLVALFHRFERFALSWDIQFEDGLRTAFRMGVDGLFSDWVDRMMAVYADEIGGI